METNVKFRTQVARLPKNHGSQSCTDGSRVLEDVGSRRPTIVPESLVQLGARMGGCPRDLGTAPQKDEQAESEQNSLAQGVARGMAQAQAQEMDQKQAQAPVIAQGSSGDTILSENWRIEEEEGPQANRRRLIKGARTRIKSGEKSRRKIKQKGRSQGSRAKVNSEEKAIAAEIEKERNKENERRKTSDKHG